MPQSPERKREYNRERQRAQRAKTGTTGEDFNGEHYWGAVSKAPDGFRVCTAFEFQGRMIGGCGLVLPWVQGKMPVRSDGQPDLSQAVTDSAMAKETYEKMPRQKERKW